MTKEDPVIHEREKICARLGFRTIMNVHEFLMKSRNSPGTLRSRMLNPAVLEQLGYNKSVLKQYGWDEKSLAALGFESDEKPLEKKTKVLDGDEELLALIKRRARKSEFRERGYGIHNLRSYCSASEAMDLGFELHDLASAFPARDLKTQCGLGPRELCAYYPDHEVREICSAREFYRDGFDVEELRHRFKFNDNQILGSGVDIRVRNKHGIRHRTVDDTSLKG